MIWRSPTASSLPHEVSPFNVVTISAGVVALIPTAEHTPERLVTLADAALYRSKKQGRNQVNASIA